MANVGQEPDELDRPAEEDRSGSVPDSVPDQSAQPPPAVRFKSTVEEIVTRDAESGSPAGAATATPFSLGEPGDNVTPEQIRHLSDRLKACPLQERRMNIFSYEPFSLPASRTASHEDDSREPSREPTRSSAGRQSPLLNTSVRASEMHTPPLTPAGTASGEGLHREAANSRDPDQLGRAPDIITPLDSAQDVPSPSSPRPSVQRGASADQASPRPVTSDEKEHSHGSLGDHRRGLFSLSTANNSPTGSVPVSRETSPSRAAAASQFYTRHAPPPGEVNDPYAANKRQAQKGIDPRFVFSRKKKGSSPSSSTISLPRASTDKRLGRHKDEHLEESFAQSKNSSMADLKRFFKLGSSNKAKRTASPVASIRSNAKTPPGSRSSQIPFGDDHGLTSKYGKLGKVLGAGAGGSVRLMKRAEDSVVFAVKEFRPRHSYETEREYVKKLTAEYCMGSSLHHGNIIETLDIVQEKGKWYEVMEYAPYDLFAIVMTGKMSREEVSCCFLQILSGVTYLHSMGLAHRDLKLDNVVVSDRGIMKIIDFGSAHVYRYPFENGIVPAGGIVGSDPYLAPEVYDEKKYDPQAVDIWSLAIIYCCMTLRRFPWKVPRLTDNSFRLFAADPSPGHDPKKLILPHASSTSALSSTPARDYDYPSFVGQEGKSGHEADKSTPAESTQRHEAAGTASTGSAAGAGGGGDKKEVVRGPWRILRLLPRESRNVIEGMLAIDPKKRAKMSEILEDPWVANTVICRQIEAGVVVNSDDHTHVLEPPSSAASAGK